MLDRFVTDVRAGSSGVLVVRGDAGVGKTALLASTVERADGCRVLRAGGVESELELAFAGLHQLCTPVLDHLDRLPGPQREALATAFGLHAGGAPDRFLVGLAVLTLLSDVAEERPLLCLVDDAQWVDRASVQVLAFVARRLGAESVGLLLGVRDPLPDPLAGLPELTVGGLDDEAARTLLDAVVPGPLDDQVRMRILAETRGNPLALLELPRGSTSAQLAFGPGPGDPTALTGRIEAGFAQRVQPLPPATRRLLLAAAAEPVGDVTLLWRAAQALGVDPDALAPALDAGLVELGATVRFRHPLVRSAVYRAAPPDERRAAHLALAAATDPVADPDRRAWHRAQATAGLDEEVAAELERSADRARARGGLAAGASFLERAAELTPEPGLRARRLLAAAEAEHRAGAPQAALRLLGVAQGGPLDDLDGARAELLRAQVTSTVTRGGDAPALLLAAARRLEPLDATMAREAYLDAFSAALFAGRLARGAGVPEVARAVLAARWGPSTRPSPPAARLLLDGLAVLVTQGHAAGAPLLLGALRAVREELTSGDDALRWLWLACRVARDLGDDATWDELTARQVQLARRTGALAVLPIALTERYSVHLFAGEVAQARSLAAEAQAVSAATGSRLSPHISFLSAAWQAHEEEALALVETSRQDVVRRGEGLWLVATEWTSAVLLNGLGRFAEALEAAERAAEHPHDLGLSTWVWPELVEAAARSGDPGRAAAALSRLTEIARATGTDWVLGVEARSRALVSAGPAAEACHREALDRLGRTRVRVTLARAHLLYGEWLRREGRRIDAREQLRTAHTMLADLGMDAYTERARRELAATGETARKRTVDTVDDLTAQEAQIARLAADRLTNPEIGAELFLSPRTVEWHLRKVFGKLGVTSRRELHKALARP